MTPEKRQRSATIVDLILKGWQPPKQLPETGFLRLVDDIARVDHKDGPAPTLALSDVELVVLSLLADGHTNQTAADAMHYSVHTVKWHMKSILHKLGAKNAAHAVAIAYRARILDLRRAA